MHFGKKEESCIQTKKNRLKRLEKKLTPYPDEEVIIFIDDIGMDKDKLEFIDQNSEKIKQIIEEHYITNEPVVFLNDLDFDYIIEHDLKGGG